MRTTIAKCFFHPLDVSRLTAMSGPRDEILFDSQPASAPFTLSHAPSDFKGMLVMHRHRSLSHVVLCFCFITEDILFFSSPRLILDLGEFLALDTHSHHNSYGPKKTGKGVAVARSEGQRRAPESDRLGESGGGGNVESLLVTVEGRTRMLKAPTSLQEVFLQYLCMF